MLHLRTGILLFALAIIEYSNEKVVPLAYSPELGVNVDQIQSPNIQPVPIKLEEFKYPSHYNPGVYRAAIGNFSPYFGLNTTAEDLAYFIIGRDLSAKQKCSNWLRMEPDIVALSPVVTKLANNNPETETRVFISDTSTDCLELREAVSSNFQWTIVASDNYTALLKELKEFKPYVVNKKVSYAICDSVNGIGFVTSMLDLLLKNGIYHGSEVYIYTYLNMKNENNHKAIEEFASAGAYLGVVTPALSSSDLTAVPFTVMYIGNLSSYIKNNGDIDINGETVPFTSANFLKLIHSKKCNISNNVMDIVLDYSTNGELGTLSFYICEFQPFKCTPGYYKVKDSSLEIGITLGRRNTVKALVFQDITFFPSFEDSEVSLAIQMIGNIFSSDASHSYELVAVPYNSNVIVQETLVKTLNSSKTTYTMSAFPILLDPNLDVQYTHAVFYDGIVMIKIREATDVNLFHIFDVLSGFIWLCVFVSLLVVALIFFVIKVVNDRQARQMGKTPEDDDIPLHRQFFNVIYQNFSAVLLAKVLVKPNQPSIRVLYQSYWLVSILFVATYAAALAEQRFIARETPVPFDSLRGLANNNQNYKWFFIRNSSAVWKMKNSNDAVLNKLMNDATTKWPDQMYVDSISEVVKKIETNNKLILVCSRMEAEQILSGECRLSKSSLVEYLYGIGYLFSGPKEFVTKLKNRIEYLSSSNVFEKIEKRTVGLGDCPLSSEAINMLHLPITLKEFGGIFIIVLIGIIVAFIVSGIEFLIENYPSYRQRKQDNDREFGNSYIGSVLKVQEDGIWVRVDGTNDTIFADTNHVKVKRNEDGRFNLQVGNLVKATYMGNDPITTLPIYNIYEERSWNHGNSEGAPPLDGRTSN
nr:hypothetical protein HmN_000483600 [Hymenolepis microstoma]